MQMAQRKQFLHVVSSGRVARVQLQFDNDGLEELESHDVRIDAVKGFPKLVGLVFTRRGVEQVRRMYATRAVNILPWPVYYMAVPFISADSLNSMTHGGLFCDGGTFWAPWRSVEGGLSASIP